MCFFVLKLDIKVSIRENYPVKINSSVNFVNFLSVFLTLFNKSPES